MRRHLKTALSRTLAWTGGDRLYGTLAGHRRAPMIVGYHRVVKEYARMKRTSIPAMLITSGTFEQQVDWIARRYRVTTLDAIGSKLESGDPFEERLAAITFDDGYADVYENAFPILRRKGLPATMFVVTDLIGRARLQSFDRLYLLLSRALARPGGIDWVCDVAGAHAIPAGVRARLSRLPKDPVRTTQTLLKTLPQHTLDGVLAALEARFPMPAGCFASHRALDWEMLEEMQSAGMTIGSHTRSHPLLTLETSATVRAEVEGSRRLLQQWLGGRIDHFAYPDGRFDATVVSAVKKAGYRFGFGVCAHRDASEPLLTIPRRMLWENSCLDRSGRFCPAVMSCSTNGIFDLMERCRRDHRGATAAALAAVESREDLKGSLEGGGFSRAEGRLT